jgi:hypothetical protein
MAAPQVPKLPSGVDVVAPFPESIQAVRHVRSTILVASVDNLRHLGQFDAYLAHLPKQHHSVVLGSVAATWVPISEAFAHYAAIDALELPPLVQIGMGRRAMDRVAGTLLGTSLSVAKGAGVTPWTILPRVQRFWRRGYDGGGLAVFKLGPKEARIDVAEFSLCTIPFYRRALMGWVSGITELFCSKAYVHEKGSPHGAHSLSVRVQWV